MFKAGYEGQTRYGADYAISGKDGVHPGWAGHLVMAYAFLRAMGLDGDLGTFTVDLGAQTATASAGHSVESFNDNQLTVVSTKYPFCASGETNSDNSLRSGATLVPFFQELSRFNLVVKNAQRHAVSRHLGKHDEHVHFGATRRRRESGRRLRGQSILRIVPAGG